MIAQRGHSGDAVSDSRLVGALGTVVLIGGAEEAIRAAAQRFLDQQQEIDATPPVNGAKN